MLSTESVVLFLPSLSPHDNVLASDTSEKSYRRLAHIARYRNIDLRFVLGESSFKNGTFTNYWTFKKNIFTQIKETFIPKMMYAYHRSSLFDNMPRINNPLIERICIDKLLTAQTFPALVKKTVSIDENTLSNIQKINSELVVVKPLSGSGGINVQVLPKEKITKALLKNDTYIIQEFIDSSGGIPNLIDQRHEMRIFVFNNTINSAYLRLPQEDSYLCNVAQGAKEMQITNSQIPSSFISAVSEIDKAFSHVTPRHYTVDIMNEGDRPWIVELNNTPGLPDVKVQPLTDTYFNALLDTLTGKKVQGISLNQV